MSDLKRLWKETEEFVHFHEKEITKKYINFLKEVAKHYISKGKRVFFRENRVVHYGEGGFGWMIVDGNGMTARALAALILHLSEFDIKKFFALDDYYDSDRSAYHKTLDSVDQKTLDLTQWQLSIDKHKKDAKGQIPLTKRQMKIIEYIQKNGRITAGGAAEMFKISRQAALDGCLLGCLLGCRFTLNSQYR